MAQRQCKSSNYFPDRFGAFVDQSIIAFARLSIKGPLIRLLQIDHVEKLVASHIEGKGGPKTLGVIPWSDRPLRRSEVS